MEAGKRTTSFAAVLIAALVPVLSACTSTDRLWRISPLSGAGESSSERINLWPLAYHGDEGTSILWPFFDVDDRGFAVRPLVSKDGTTWSVAYPWASWDTESGEGWAFPYYQYAGNRGVLPLVNLGEWSWVGPIWWRKNPVDGAASGGLFPLAYFGRFQYVGPVWWDDELTTWGFFPLFGKNLAGVNHVGLVYWLGDPGERTWGVLPLIYYADGGNRLSVLPFYAHQLSDDSHAYYYLMGLGLSSSTGDLRRRWLLPFWYSRHEPESKDDAVLPFYYRRERGEDAHVFTLLGDRREAPEGSSLNLYPLWWSNESEGSTWKMLLPFFYYREEGDKRSLITTLGGRGWSTTGQTRYLNVLGPLYHRSRTEDGESRTAFLWPLFERHRRGEETTTRALPLYTHTSNPEGSETWLVLGLGHRSRSEAGSSWRLSPLAAGSDEAELPDILYMFNLYHHHDNGERIRRHLFPLYSGYSDADGTRHQFLLGFGKYEQGAWGRSGRAWPLLAFSEERRHDFFDSLTLFGRSSWQTGSSIHVGTPLLYAREVRERGGRSESNSRLLTFFTRDIEDRASGHVPRDESGSTRQNLVGLRRVGFLLSLFKDESTEYRVWKIGILEDEEAEELHRWARRYDDVAFVAKQRDSELARQILADHGVETEGDPDTVQDAVHAFAEENSETIVRRHVRLPLLYTYERRGRETEWYGPLWMLHWKRDETTARFSFLYYAFLSKTAAGKTSRDIFPFITWDSSKEETTFSFLWRLFRYERDGERRGGYFFFVPWGDV